MARKLRVEYAGACYHVINRGNYRRDLFSGKGAAESFERCLFETAAQFGWRVHAFVVMRNHFHLAVETPEPNLSDGMRWLQGTWAMRFNRKRGEVGRPFQGRYKALHVEPGHALAQVIHYIHLNPVRAKVVAASQLQQFRWSSLHWFPTKQRPECLEPATLLHESGGLRDTVAGWGSYQGYLELLAEEEAKLRDAQFGRLSRGWMVGSKAFKAELRAELSKQGADFDRFGLAGADREAQRELKADVWEEKLQQLASEMAVTVDTLPAKKSATEKVVIAAVMKASTSVTNGWLAERLWMGEPATVSQYVRRFGLAGGFEQRTFKRLLLVARRSGEATIRS